MGEKQNPVEVRARSDDERTSLTSSSSSAPHGLAGLAKSSRSPTRRHSSWAQYSGGRRGLQGFLGVRRLRYNSPNIEAALVSRAHCGTGSECRGVDLGETIRNRVGALVPSRIHRQNGSCPRSDALSRMWRRCPDSPRSSATTSRRHCWCVVRALQRERNARQHHEQRPHRFRKRARRSRTDVGRNTHFRRDGNQLVRHRRRRNDYLVQSNQAAASRGVYVAARRRSSVGAKTSRKSPFVSGLSRVTPRVTESVRARSVGGDWSEWQTLERSNQSTWGLTIGADAFLTFGRASVGPSFRWFTSHGVSVPAGGLAASYGF